MYLSYYKLKRSPFQITSDPRFLWLGETHREALATLKYGIYEDKSFLMLTGDVGCGKTTLINSFVKKLNENVLCGVLCDPGLSLMDLFNHIAFLFGLNHTFTSKGEFIIAFSRFLNNVHDAGKRVLLIIDEAQRIQADLLEEICMLSNIERDNAKLINIFFVGQNEFRDMVARHANQSLKQKLTFSCQVTTLDESDLVQYIRHRLKIAGATHPIFTDNAFSIIFHYSGGNPRITNIICDLALLTGFVQEKEIIDGQMVQECVAELQLQPVTSRDPSVLSGPLPETVGSEKSAARWEDTVEYPGKTQGAETHDKTQEVVFPDPEETWLSEPCREELAPALETASPMERSIPKQKHKKGRLRGDRQLQILLGLMVLVLVLSLYIFFQERGGL